MKEGCLLRRPFFFHSKGPALIEMLFEAPDTPTRQRRHGPVNQKASQVDFDAVGPIILRNDEIALPQKVNKANGISKGPFLHEIDEGIAKVRQGNECRLGEDHMAHCLDRTEAHTDGRFILPFGDSGNGRPKDFGNVGPKKEDKGQDGKVCPADVVDVIIKLFIGKLRQSIKYNEQQYNGRRASHDVRIGMSKAPQHLVLPQFGPSKEEPQEAP